MSVFSTEVDERASNSDLASDCEVGKDKNVSEVIKKFLQEDSECESSDNDSSETAAKDLLNENSRSNFSEKITSDEDVCSNVSENSSKVKSISSSASFQRRIKPIFTERNDTDSESDASNSVLTLPKKQSHSKFKVHHDDGLFRNGKKSPHASIESNRHDKTSATSQTKMYPKKNTGTKERQIKGKVSVETTKQSHSINERISTGREKKRAGEISVLNVGSSSVNHAKSLKRQKSDDMSSSNETLSSHSKDKLLVKNSASRKQSSDKRNQLEHNFDKQHCNKEKAQHSDKKSHLSEKFIEANRKKEKSTREILCINSEQLNKAEKKSLSIESRKGEQTGKKNKDKHKFHPEPGSLGKGLSFFSCTTSSSASLWQNSLFSSEPKIRKQRSVSPIFVKVKIGDAKVFVESEIREDRKLWLSSRVNLTSCDDLLRKFQKRRKLDDSLTFKSSFSPDAVQRKTDQDKRLEFSKKIVKSQKDCKANDHDTLKKSKNYDDQPHSKIKHLSKEAHNLEKEKVKNKDDRLQHEQPKQSLFHKHLTDKSDDKCVSKTLGGCLSKDKGSKSLHTEKSHDQRKNQSHREDSHHHEKSHSVGKSPVNHSNHERKSNHKGKSRHHSKDSLKNRLESFVEKEIKEQKSSQPESSKQSDLQDESKKSRLQENSKNFSAHVDSKNSGLNVDSTLCKKSSQSNAVETIAPLKTHKKGISYILSDSEDVVSDCNENVKSDLSGSENTRESKNSKLKTDFSGNNFELMDIGVIPGVDRSELAKCNMDESKQLEDESANEMPASEMVKGMDFSDASMGSLVSNLVICDTESLKEAGTENLNDVPDSSQDNKVLGVSDEQTCDSSLNDKLLSDIFCSKTAVELNSEAVTELSVYPDENVDELRPSVDDAEEFLLNNAKKLDNIDSMENHEKEKKVEDKELDVDPFPNVLPVEEQNLMRSAEDEAALDSSRLKEVSDSGEDNSKTFEKEDGGVCDMVDLKCPESERNEITSKEKEPLALGDGDHSCRQQMCSPLPEDAELIGSASDFATSMCSVGSSDARMPSKLQFSLQHFGTDPKYQPFVKLERLPESVAKKLLAEWKNWSKRMSHAVGTNQSSKSSSLENNTSESERVNEKVEKRTPATEDFSTIEKRKRSISSVDDISSTEPSAQRLKSDDDHRSERSGNSRQDTEKSSTTDPVSRSLMKVRAEFKKQGEIFGRSTDREKRQKHESVREEKTAETDFLLNQKRNKISSFVIPKIKSSEKNEKKKKKPPQVQYETVVWTPPPASPRVRKPPLPMRTSMEDDKDRSVLAKVEGSVRERENFQWQAVDNWRGSSSVHGGEWRRLGPPDRAGDRWNSRQFGSYGCEQGNRDRNREISKNGINGRFTSGNSESSGFHRNVNPYGSQSNGNARQLKSSQWTEKRQQQETSIEKKEEPSMEWIRLYNRDPLGLMTQSTSDDRDGSFSPPGAADDGDDDEVIKTGNRYETKSTLLTDDSNSMLENVKLLANTIQEVLTSGTAVSANKRQRLSEFHSQLQKSLILPSTEVPDNLALLNMICDSVNQAKNFVTMFQSMMQEDFGSLQEEMSSSKKPELSLNHGVSPKMKNLVDLHRCPLSKQNDGFDQGNIGAYDDAIRTVRERHNFSASVQPVLSSEFLNAGKSDSVYSPASITLSRTPNSAGVVSDVGPKLNSSIRLMDIDERVNMFQDIDERKSFFAEKRFSRQFDDRTEETSVLETDNYNSVSHISGKSNENIDFVCNQEFSNRRNEESKCKLNTALDNSPKEAKSEAAKSQMVTVSRIEDELQLLEMLVTIQSELAEIDSAADSADAAPSVCVNKTSSTDSEATAPAVSTNSSSALSNVTLTSPVGQTVSSSLADDTSQDSTQSSGSRKVSMPKTPSDEPRVVDLKLLEDKVIGFARNALKPYYHRGVVTSEEFKLIMRKVISKVKVKSEEEIKEAKIVQLIGAYVDRIVSQRKKIQL